MFFQLRREKIVLEHWLTCTERSHFKPVQPVSVSEIQIPAVIASAMAAYATEEAVRAGINNGGSLVVAWAGSLVVAWANSNEAGFG